MVVESLAFFENGPAPALEIVAVPVASARKLAIRLYWMLRTQKAYPAIISIKSSSRVALVVRHGG